jgi:hypothetical protein
VFLVKVLKHLIRTSERRCGDGLKVMPAGGGARTETVAWGGEAKYTRRRPPSTVSSTLQRGHAKRARPAGTLSSAEQAPHGKLAGAGTGTGTGTGTGAAAAGRRLGMGSALRGRGGGGGISSGGSAC